jgi:arylsulfatase A-like enzyme
VYSSQEHRNKVIMGNIIVLFVSSVQNYDEEFRSLLKKLVKNNGRNTVIIFMSDHGFRHDSFRETFLGYYEDALPFFALRLPVSLKWSHPSWYSNLRRNSERLTSPFDLYSTLRDILSLAETSAFENDLGLDDLIPNARDNFREADRTSISLFELGPATRTCESAGIPQEFCRCGATPKTFYDVEPIL